MSRLPKKLPTVITDGGRSTTEPHETADCTVRAFALVTELSYGDAHGVLERAGRKRRCRFNFHRAMRTSLRSREWNGWTFQERHDVDSMTVGRFVSEHPTGRYIVRVRGHVFAVLDGTVFDAFQLKPRMHVVQAWKAINSENK